MITQKTGNGNMVHVDNPLKGIYSSSANYAAYAYSASFNQVVSLFLQSHNYK